MCRHFLPRFDLPIAQTVHDVGRLVATHPVLTLSALLVPLVIVLGVLIHHRLMRPVFAHRNPIRAEMRREPPGLVSRELLVVH